MDSISSPNRDSRQARSSRWAGKNFDGVAARAQHAAIEIGVVALVLQLGQVAQDLRAVDPVPHRVGLGHFQIGFGVADTVDAGDRRHDDHITPLEQHAGGGVTHPVDLLVDRGFLLDIGVRARDIGLGLVIVVIGDEILDRVVGEEVFHLPEQLGGERLVGGQDQRRTPCPLDHMSHGEGFARPGNAEKHLIGLPRIDACDQILNGFGLVAGWLVVGLQIEVRTRIARRMVIGKHRARQFLRHRQVLRLNF